MKNLTICTLGFVCSILFSISDASAVVETIDFESQGAAGVRFLPSLTTPLSGTTVMLSVLENIYSGPIASGQAPRIAKYGPNPTSGFSNLVDGADTPDQSSPLAPDGMYFITNGARSPVNLGDYAMSFDRLVNNVSLLLYDYRSDGNTDDGNPGVDSITLRGYDASMNLVDSFTYVVPDPRPVDGNIVLMALDPSSSVRSIRLEFGGFDFGTGVDNLSFQVVPEPTAYATLLVGLVTIMAARRRRS